MDLVTCNVDNKIKRYKDKLLIYFEATETEKQTNKFEVARLKWMLGSEALKLFNTLKSSE